MGLLHKQEKHGGAGGGAVAPPIFFGRASLVLFWSAKLTLTDGGFAAIFLKSN